jgi:drug/metabolite transporter (DMT)-like permease
MCSITWALTLVTLRYVERDHSRPGLGMSAVAAGNLFASIAALPFALPLPAASTGEWITIVYLGVCQIGLAYVCLTAGIRHLPALDVSLLLLVEPVLNPVWTWILRGESAGSWTIVGGAIILAATAVRSLRDPRVSPRLLAE